MTTPRPVRTREKIAAPVAQRAQRSPEPAPARPPEPVPDTAAPAVSNQWLLSALAVRSPVAVVPPDDPHERGAERTAAAFTAARVPRGALRAMQASQGESLAAPVRRDFETLFRADFSDVRLHRDRSARDAARAFGARAFARDASIYFADAAFEPSTPGGRHLLAHELAHVVQQGRARSPLAPPAGASGSEAEREREADAAAAHVAARGAPGRLAHSLPPSSIARQHDPAASADAADAGVTDAGTTTAATTATTTTTTTATGGGPVAVQPPVPADSRRAPAPPTGGSTIIFENRVLSPDHAWCRYVLTQTWIAEGETATVDFVGRFRTQVTEARFNRSDMSGVTEESEALSHLIETRGPVAEALEEELAALRGERDAYLAEFRARAEIATAGMLDLSRQRVTSELARYGLTRSEHIQTYWRRDGEGGSIREERIRYSYGMGGGAAAASTEGMASAARELAAGARRILAAQEDRNGAQGMVPAAHASDDGIVAMEYGIVDQTRYDAASRRMGEAEREYQRLRVEKEQDYPILAAYTSYDQQGGTHAVNNIIERLDTLGRGSTSDNAQTLYQQVDDTLHNIDTTWNNLQSGDLDIWNLPPVIATTKASLGLADDSLRNVWIDAEVHRRSMTSLVINIALGVLALALGLLAAIPSGGSSLVAAGTFIAGIGAAGISTYFAGEHIHSYLLESAASGTDFDKARAISSADPSLFWLALDIVGAILDIHAANTAFEALSRTVREAVALRRAARTAEEAVAADAKLQEVVTTAARHDESGALGRRLADDVAAEAARTGEQLADRGVRQWENAITPESRAFLVDHPPVRTTYAEMSPRVREALTFCASVCIIPTATTHQADRLEHILSRLGEGAPTERLQQYLHAHADDLDAALHNLEGMENWGQFEAQVLAHEMGAAPGENPFANLGDDETSAALDQMFSPELEGGARPTIEGHRVPLRQRRRLDIQDIPRHAGETARAALARVEGVVSHHLNEFAPINNAWDRARTAVLANRGPLTASNYEELYNLTRNRFWSEVRADADARRLFTDAGFEFPDGATTAPLLSAAPSDVSRTEIRISLDHVLEKAIGNNWRLALDAGNLRMEFAMPNTYREIIQARHPELR